MVGIQQAVIVALGSSGDYETLQVINAIFAPATLLVMLPVQAFLAGGLINFSLMVARGRKPEFNDVFKGGRYFGTMLVAMFLLGLGYFVGALLCLVPGVIFLLGCSLYGFFVVDQNLGSVDALKRSWEFTKGHKVNLLVLMLLLSLVSLLGLLACCIGQLIVVPMYALALAFAYLRIKGETPMLPA